MKILDVLKNGIPLIIGIVIGAGLTKNKGVVYLIIFYVVMMILFNIIKTKITDFKKADNKTEVIKEMGYETIGSTIDATAKGNKIGANLFDKYYPEYIFYINVILFISTIVLLFKLMFYWAILCFGILHIHIVLNQIYRKVKHNE